MKGLVKSSLGVVALLGVAGTAHATNVTLTPNTSVALPAGCTPGTCETASFSTFDPPPAGFGVITATFDHNGIPSTSGQPGGILLTDGTLSPAGYGVDTFLFQVFENGNGSGSVTTSTTLLGSPSDLDFLKVLVNGVLAQHTVNTGLTDQWSATNVPITAGVTNTIQLVYLSRGAGSYGGQATFTPVPEPATWGMMLLGFGAIGFSMRRRRKVSAKLAQFA